MSTVLTLLGYLVALTAVLAIVYAAKAVRLQNRFRRMGKAEGRTLDEVVKLLGPPSNHTKLPTGREILEWRRVGFHHALSFTNGICDGQMDVNAP
jgi:hypothetical protein